MVSQPMAYRQRAAQAVGAGHSVARATPFWLSPVAGHLPAARVLCPDQAVFIATIGSGSVRSGLQAVIASLG